MHYPIKYAPVLLPRRVSAKNPFAENSAVQRAVGSEQVRGARREVGDDRGVSFGPWRDDLSREKVRVDYGQVVRRRGEDGGDGGFAGGDGAREADDEHSWFFFLGKGVCVYVYM